MKFKIFLVFTLLFSLNFNKVNAEGIDDIIADYNKNPHTSIKFNTGARVFPSPETKEMIKSLCNDPDLNVSSLIVKNIYADPIIKKPLNYPRILGENCYFNGNIEITEINPYNDNSYGCFIFSSIESADRVYSYPKYQSMPGQFQHDEKTALRQYAKTNEAKDHFLTSLLELLKKASGLKPTFIMTKDGQQDIEPFIQNFLKENGFTVSLLYNKGMYLTKSEDLERSFNQ